MENEAIYSLLDSLNQRITQLENIPDPANSDRTARSVAGMVDLDKVEAGWALRSQALAENDRTAVKYLRAKKLVDDYLSNHSTRISSGIWPLLRARVRCAGKGKEYTAFMDDVLTIASEKFC